VTQTLVKLKFGAPKTICTKLSSPINIFLKACD